MAALAEQHNPQMPSGSEKNCLFIYVISSIKKMMKICVQVIEKKRRVKDATEF